LPKTEARGWLWCRLPGNDHVRGQFGECHYCDDGYEYIEELLDMEARECRCRGDDDTKCYWHNQRFHSMEGVELYYQMLAPEDGA
jgi:hypothetical protein